MGQKKFSSSSESRVHSSKIFGSKSIFTAFFVNAKRKFHNGFDNKTIVQDFPLFNCNAYNVLCGSPL